MFQLRQLLICFKNDVMEKQADETATKLKLAEDEINAEIKAMRAEMRK